MTAPTASPPATTVTVPPAPTVAPGAASAAATIRHFDLALVNGDAVAAQHYLVPHFRPSCGGAPTSVTAIACLQRPQGYLPLPAHAVYITGNHASASVVYELPSGRVPRSISLVQEGSGWRVASITEVQG